MGYFDNGRHPSHALKVGKDGRVGEPVVWSDDDKKREQQKGEAGGASKRARAS